MLKGKCFLLFIVVIFFVGIFVGSVSVSAAKYTFKLADVNVYSNLGETPTHAHQVGAEMFKKLVEERSNGEIEVTLHPGGVFGSDAQAAENVRAGSIAIAHASASNIATLVPELGFFGVNHIFEDYDHLKRAFYDDEQRILHIYQQIFKEKENGLKLLALTVSGTRNVYNRLRPINNVEDIQGIKIRVMESPIEGKVWSTIGALPVSIAFTEIYSAIQAGVADAGEGSMGPIYFGKFYEVAPYIAYTKHKFNILTVIMNQKIFEELPAELQEVVQEAASEAYESQIEAAERLEGEAIELLKASPGVVFTEPDMKGFMEKMGSLKEEEAKRLGVTEVLEIIESVK
ncbi:MAG: TRAP transporter substrate-binding protein [Atribacterota bacterium]|nr:TRAP transporter substrate-binding protein [Atribacterota bacterium]